MSTSRSGYGRQPPDGPQPSSSFPPVETVLTKYERNALLTAIEESGAPVTEFELSAAVAIGTPYRGAFVLVSHPGSASLVRIFVFEGPQRTFTIGGEIGNGDPALTRSERMASFAQTLSRGLPPHVLQGKMALPVLALSVATWAKTVVSEFREYEATPDLWAEIRQSRELFVAPLENTIFTEGEQAEISNYLRELKEYIKTTYELTAGEMAEVEQKLDQAEEASHKMGGKDWLMLFNGALFSLVVTDLIPPQAVQHILLMTLHSLGHLFGFGAPPPLPPYAG